ncbi:chemotaxis protein CheW [Bdellovibrio sp. ZAP7]|uniref:chemotaxis protein CheW n=1 Tax=Bdellovibrio sp. ZAP7 TaxID=2231053 RepID=UPI00115A545E|nr:chemotaxis protein CheW [Bdellovibrio sp. ZAP7]QDK43861.1 chemotaxis protein CheW [Bdellovibrio sp. ZAP7]
MSEQYLTLSVNKQTYGLPISTIREINRISEITSVPDSPAHVVGVMNLRGRVIPVVDLRMRLRSPAVDITKETCTVVVETSNKHIGIIVDSVSSVIVLDEKNIDREPIAQEGPKYVIGVGNTEDGMILLLDIDKCLQQDINQAGYIDNIAA